MGFNGPQGNRCQGATLNNQRQGDCHYHNGHCRQNNGHNVLTYNGQDRKCKFHTHVTCTDYSVLNMKGIKKPISFQIDLHKQKNSQKSERKVALGHGKISASESISRLHPVCWPSTFWSQVPLRKDSDKTPKGLTVSLSPILPQKNLWPFIVLTVHWEKKKKKQSDFPGSAGYWFWIDAGSWRTQGTFWTSG